jgi:predicted aspartyl protease
MRSSSLAFAIAAISCFPIQIGHAAGSAPPPAALKTFLEREGYGGSPLQRRFGNHLFVNTVINGKRTALMVDTGCPFTLIDRGSARKLGLGLKETKESLVGVTGQAKRFALSNLATVAMGNCTFTNVPIQVADEAQINELSRPHLDGLFGAHEMAKFGMVVDCTRQMMYVNPKGPSAASSQKLAQFLAGRGFVRIPMRFDTGHHLQVDAQINGHPTRLIVDTGAFTTLLSAPAATEYGTSMSRRFSAGGEGIGTVGQLSVGDLTISNAEVMVANVAKMVGTGLLGEEYLSWNFAVVDVGGMNLYLRPPESAPAKKR